LADLTDFGVLFRYEPYPELEETLDRTKTADQTADLIGHVKEKLHESENPQ